MRAIFGSCGVYCSTEVDGRVSPRKLKCGLYVGPLCPINSAEPVRYACNARGMRVTASYHAPRASTSSECVLLVLARSDVTSVQGRTVRSAPAAT